VEKNFCVSCVEELYATVINIKLDQAKIIVITPARRTSLFRTVLDLLLRHAFARFLAVPVYLMALLVMCDLPMLKISYGIGIGMVIVASPIAIR